MYRLSENWRWHALDSNQRQMLMKKYNSKSFRLLMNSLPFLRWWKSSEGHFGGNNIYFLCRFETQIMLSWSSEVFFFTIFYFIKAPARLHQSFDFSFHSLSLTSLYTSSALFAYIHSLSAFQLFNFFLVLLD